MTRTLAASLAATFIAGLATAADPDVTETFEDVNGLPFANGWTDGAGSVWADFGQDGVGDHVLAYIAANSPNNGFHVLHPAAGSAPDPAFTGDYTGIACIQFWARHTGVGDTVVLRFTLFDDFNDGLDWVMTDATATVQSSATAWTLYTIPLDPATMISSSVNGRTVTEILASVAQAGLRHDPFGTGPGTPSSVTNPTEVLFDDLVLRELPSNDTCDEAILLSPNDSIDGTTICALPATGLGDCGLASEGTGGIAWYSVIGTGTEITASTCFPLTDFDTTVSIWTGDCNGLVCYWGVENLAAGTDPACEAVGAGGYNSSARVTWCTEPGVEYFIAVYGDTYGSEGDFTLGLSTGAPCAIPNNDCANATSIGVDSVTTGTTTGASQGLLGCNDNPNSIYEAVWYTVTGTGSLLTASLRDDYCTGQGAVESGSLRLRVYTDGCGTETCVSSSNLGVITWCAEAGRDYLIEVENAGDFTLELCAGDPCLIPNDLCVNAISVAPGMSVPGSTVGAAEAAVPTCGTPANAGGVWYSLIGTGTEITATTCATDCGVGAGMADFDARVKVYTGVCGDLSCVSDYQYGNNSCVGDPGAETIRWCAEAGVEYLIRVSGYDEEGSFVLEICGGDPCPPLNEACVDAITLQPNDVIDGSTIGATTSEFDAGSVWYTVIGTGETMTATTCAAAILCTGSGQSDYESIVTVYDGSCGALNEIDEDRNGCPGSGATANWCSVLGVVYYIRVTGWYQEGHFTLELCTGPFECPPTNDDCPDAELVLPGFLYEGTTIGASVPNVDGGGGNFGCSTILDTSGGVWFRVMGDNREMTATTCAGITDFDTRLRVYSLCYSGTSWECTAVNDDQHPYYDLDPACDPLGTGFNTSSTVTWCATVGEVYYILVDGYYQEGNFGLYLTEGDICAGPGACCLDAGGCVDDVTRYECLDIVDGTWMGPGSTCALLDCGGACCLLDGTCVDDVSLNDCIAANGGDVIGAYKGPGTSCATDICPFLVSADGLWTASIVPHSGIVGSAPTGTVWSLYRQDTGPVDYIYTTFFDDANTLTGGETGPGEAGQGLDQYFTISEGPIIDRGRTHSWAKYTVVGYNSTYSVEVDNYMISGPAGGVLIIVRATNITAAFPLDMKLFYFANVQINGDAQFDWDATPVFDGVGGPFLAAEFIDQAEPASERLWFGGCDGYVSWEIGTVCHQPAEHCGNSGLDCDLNCGIAELAGVDGTPPGNDDHAAAVSGPTVTLAPGESVELRVGIGGVGFGSCATPPLGDIDGDGIVGVSDLLRVLADWGPCADCGVCPADLDASCTVDVADLLMVLGNWSALAMD